MAVVVQPKEIASTIKGVAQTAQQVSGMVQQEQSPTDWMDKGLKMLETIDSILGKSDQLQGVLGGIVDKKQGIESRPKDNPMSSPVLQEKKALESAVPSPPVEKPIPVQQPQQPKREITMDEVVERVNTLIEEGKAKIPEEWQNKTVKELMADYEARGDFMKRIIAKVVFDTVYASFGDLMQK